LDAKNADAGSVMVTTNFATPTTKFDMIVSAQAEVDGKQITVVAPALEVEVVPGYEIRLSSKSLELAPGGHIEVTGRLRREFTFEGGEIRISAEDLPEQ